VIPMQSPRGLNDASLGAFAEVACQADKILLLGKALDFAIAFGQPPGVAERCSFIQIDPDSDIIERSRRVLGDRLASAYCADAAASIASLRSAAGDATQPAREDWLDEVAAAVSYRPAEWSGPHSKQGEAVHPLDICHAVQAVLDRSPNAIVVCDGGEFGQWAQACLSAPRRIINGPAGAIGAAIPYAIAARLADPSATVVAMTGDGAVGFHIAEIDTAVRSGAPFIAVIGNDARWNAEYQIQLRDYGHQRLLGCELLPSNYGRVAEALGGHGEGVRSAAELGPALERAHASGMPACVDVRLAGQPAPKPRRPVKAQGSGPD
jgi:acetolactate synthase I/II/III large subunit